MMPARPAAHWSKSHPIVRSSLWVALWAASTLGCAASEPPKPEEPAPAQAVERDSTNQQARSDADQVALADGATETSTDGDETISAERKATTEKAPEPQPAAGAEPRPAPALTWTFKGANDEIAVTNGAVAVETVYFNFGKPILHKKSLATMDLVAAFMKKHTEVTGLRIEGHTDNRGSNAYNLRLSAARAHAIARALVARGIACGRLQPVGYGETRPIACNDCRDSRSKSRRMEFHIANLGDRQIMKPVVSAESAGAIAHDPCTALSDGRPALIAK